MPFGPRCTAAVGTTTTCFERVDEQPHVDELPRPKLQVGVGEFRLQLDRAGGLIDLVVDDLQRAAVDDGLVVGAEGVDRQRTLREGLVDLRQLLLRQREDNRRSAAAA